LIILPDGAKFDMKWRSVTYSKRGFQVKFEIIPMYDQADLVIIPSQYAWEDYTDIFNFSERDDIIYLLEKIPWNRSINLIEFDIEPIIYEDDQDRPLPGSFESSPAGREIESRNLFDPDKNLNTTQQQAKGFYLLLETKFAKQATGDIRIPRDCIISGSVLEKISVPVLENNPRVNLIWED